MGAVLIVGPKWCGKTTTATQFAKTVIELQHPTLGKSYIELADVDPLLLLDGEKPLLIDEWQMAPELWDAVRYSVDKTDGYGLYILTGSTIVDNSKINHKGVGRIHRLMMRPMSLYESGDSNGKISLIDLFNDNDVKINGVTSDLSLSDLIFLASRGGWPETLNIKDKRKQLIVASSYFDNICRDDTYNMDGVKRDSKLFEAILRSYSRNISTLANNTKIMSDIEENYGKISEPTFYSYISVLKNLFVIDNVPAWAPNIRSKQKIRKTEKKEFIDPSIAVAGLNVTPEMLVYDLETFGFIFETLCIRDLKVYSAPLGGKVLYYNDGTLEVDCVLQIADGRYGLIEFKLGDKRIDDGAKSLLKMNKLIKQKIAEGDTHIPEPNFLAVITSDSIAKVRKDGVMVIPIGALR
ncbi:MAG: ATP-binding protein [Methanobrevibacter millerae]|uniref:ATP-binding protein n=1 Tax=Methanobrevibacter millerae TaxID=230361 RepID=A0A8T3VPI2_9EURY|nr:ATP-binding protein [Methanobrevibacter millerae]